MPGLQSASPSHAHYRKLSPPRTTLLLSHAPTSHHIYSTAGRKLKQQEAWPCTHLRDIHRQPAHFLEQEVPVPQRQRRLLCRPAEGARQQRPHPSNLRATLQDGVFRLAGLLVLLKAWEQSDESVREQGAQGHGGWTCVSAAMQQALPPLLATHPAGAQHSGRAEKGCYCHHFVAFCSLKLP